MSNVRYASRTGCEVLEDCQPSGIGKCSERAHDLLSPGPGYLHRPLNSESDQSATGQLEVEAFAKEGTSGQHQPMPVLVTFDYLRQVLGKRLAFAFHDLMPFCSPLQSPANL